MTLTSTYCQELMKSGQVMLANHYHLSCCGRSLKVGITVAVFQYTPQFFFSFHMFCCLFVLFFCSLGLGFLFFHSICSVICLFSLLCSLGFSFLFFYFHMFCCLCFLCFLFFRGLFHVFSSLLVCVRSERNWIH